MKNSDWNSILLNKVGNIVIDANGTSQEVASTPAGTVSSSIGYWDLTGTFQTIYGGTNIGNYNRHLSRIS